MRDEIILSNGIVVRDLRDESRGIQVANTKSKYIFMYHTRARDFHLNVKSIIGYSDKEVSKHGKQNTNRKMD